MKRTKLETESIRVTLTKPEMTCLENITKVGSFRSHSHAIGEALRFIQALRDDSPNTTALKVLGKRFGIEVS